MPAVQSTSSNFDLPVDEIIIRAMKLIGGGPYHGEELNDGRTELQLLLRHLTNKKIPLVYIQKKTLSITSGTDTYTLPSNEEDVFQGVISTGSAELGINRVSMFEFNRISNKTQTGRPTTYMIERQRDALQIRFWPVPTEAHTFTYYSYVRPLDIVSYDENLSVQSRYLSGIIYGLAYRLGMARDTKGLTDYEIAAYEKKLERIRTSYMEEIKAAQEEDRERTSIFIRPALFRGRR